MDRFLRKFLLMLIAAAVFAVPGLPSAMASGSTVYFLNGVQQSENTAQPDDDLKMIENQGGYFSQFTDYPAGYSLLVPGHMNADLSMAAVRMLFSDDSTQLEIYYDDLAATVSSSADYVYYGNHQLLASKHHTILRDEWTEINGCRAHIIEWSRLKLARVDNDKNHYVSAEIIKNDTEVYTLLIKSAQPAADAMDIIGSFRLTGKTGTARNYSNNRPAHPNLNAETAAFAKQFFAPDSSLTWGIFEPSAPETMSYLHALENKLEHKFPLLLRYQGLDEPVPVRGLQKAYEAGRYVELTLQTTHTEQVNPFVHSGEQNNGIMYAILDGRYDDYLHSYAKALKAFGHPVLFRLNNEMNGDWCWYSAYYAGKDTDIYKAVWKYIHAIFAANGTDNVLWVWNPHDLSRPDFKWNHYLMYYPGDEYVDIIGLTGYNTGTYFPGERWREFGEIYAPLYAEYTAAFAKPFMITEFGSNSVGGNKPAWLQSMFGQIGQFPNIKAAIWWNGTDYDQQGNPGRIYLLDESETTIEVFRNHLQAYSKQVKLQPRLFTGSRFTLNYPQAPEAPQLSSFNQTIENEAQTFARQFARPELSGSLSYRVDRNSGGLLSVTLKKFSYIDRAAHPMTYWKSFTHSSRTGKAYQLKDLFRPDAAYESELNRLIAYQITGRQLRLLRPFQGIKSDQDFFLTPENLVIYYQLYEYTPYVHGFLMFPIPLEDLQPLLADELNNKN